MPRPALPVTIGLWLVLLGTALPTLAEPTAVSRGWRIVGKEKGVLVSTRQARGEPHPTLRGQATIKGSVLHVLAVVLDTKRSTRWVSGATRVDVVKELDARTQLVHMFSNLPWPIRDRDMVMRRSVQVLTQRSEFRVRFRCAPGEQAEQRGYLRVRRCDSHFDLKAADPSTTYVDYQLQLDPGGSLPLRARRWMERRIAVDTLTHLEEQVVRTHGQYKEAMALWDGQAAQSP